jgi:hypothetical protein
MKTKRLLVAALAVTLACSHTLRAQELDSAHKAIADKWNYFFKPFHEKLIAESESEIKTVTLSNQQYYMLPEHTGSKKLVRISKKEHLSDLKSVLKHRLEAYNAEKNEYEDLISGKTPVRTYHRERIDPLSSLIYLDLGEFMPNYRLVPDEEPSIAESN